MTDFKKLQNGSDIRGVAIETEGGKPVNLTQNSVVRIGAAFALFAADRANKPASELRIAIGRDSRLSGEQLTVWLADGIASVGANAYDGGLASTPAMFMCCVNELHFDAGIMVTASHLPMERNGMKFFTAIAGGLEKADITAILASAEEAAFPIAAQRGQCGTVDVMTPYVNGLKEKILSALGCAKDEKPFSGLKIVVDAGNGAGGFFAERLLEPLGADITGSRFLEPDGRFPNHQPNPENADAMRSICDAVTETGADFGIIFDTDVDRAGAVLPSDGGVIALDRNRLIALMTAILVRQYGPITVVTDSITSTGLTDFINSLGCRHHRFKRGYRNVINEAKRLLALEEAAKKAKEETDAEFANAFLGDTVRQQFSVVVLCLNLLQGSLCGFRRGLFTRRAAHLEFQKKRIVLREIHGNQHHVVASVPAFAIAFNPPTVVLRHQQFQHKTVVKPFRFASVGVEVAEDFRRQGVQSDVHRFRIPGLHRVHEIQVVGTACSIEPQPNHGFRGSLYFKVGEAEFVRVAFFIVPYNP